MTVAANYQLLDPEQIVPCPWQTRRFGGDDGVDELARSIAEVGIIEPIVVRPSAGDHAFELLCGERRLRAARSVSLAEVPAIVREDLVDDDETAATLCLTENLQRRDLHPLEEADAIARLQGLPKFSDLDAVAAELGFPISRVVRRARLSTLSDRWLSVIAGEEGSLGDHERADPVELGYAAIPIGALEAIATLTPAAQDGLLDTFIGEDDWGPDAVDDMKVSEWRHRVNDFMRRLESATWDLADGDLVPDAGPCTTCPNRSSANPSLFDEGQADAADDRCLSLPCWESKTAALVARVETDLVARHGEGNYLRLTQDYRRPDGAAYRYECEISDTPKEGFSPAVSIDGHQAGELTYARVRSTASGDSPTTAGKPAKKTVAEKRKLLERRRIRKAIEGIHLDVGRARSLPRHSDLVALAAAVGTQSNHGHSHQYAGTKGLLPAFRKLAEDRAEARRVLWVEQVWPVIESRTKCDQSWQDLKYCKARLAELREWVGPDTPLQVDIDKHLEAAAAALPEPKSWAKQAAAEKAA